MPSTVYVADYEPDGSFPVEEFRQRVQTHALHLSTSRAISPTDLELAKVFCLDDFSPGYLYSLAQTH